MGTKASIFLKENEVEIHSLDVSMVEKYSSEIPDDINAWCASQCNPVLIFESVDRTLPNRKKSFFEWTLSFKFRGALNLASLLPCAGDCVFGKTILVSLVSLVSDEESIEQPATTTVLRFAEHPNLFYEWIQMLCNKNSLHFLDHAVLNAENYFDNLLCHYLEWIERSGMKSDDCCVDSSGVLAAYGIRPARDLDFVHQSHHLETGLADVGCHNRLIEELRKTSDFNYACQDLVANPDNYFYYKGFKFTSLSLTREMKAKRLMFGVRSLKDDLDVKLIDQHLVAIEAGAEVSRRGLALRRRLAILLDFRYNQKLVQNALRRITGRE